MKGYNFRASNDCVMVEDRSVTLIHSVAKCRDMRTGEIDQLNFYYMKNLPAADVKEEFVKTILTLMVAGLGYEFRELVSFETDTLQLNAEQIWKERHEQKALPY